MPFDAADYGSVLMWLDPTDAAKFTIDTGKVSAWADKTDGPGVSQSDSDLRPTRQTNVQNSLAAVQFDGGQMALATDDPPFTAAEGRTVVVVYKLSTTGSQQAIAGQYAFSPGAMFALMTFPGDPSLAGYGADVNSSGTRNTLWRIAIVTYDDGGTASVYKNSTLLNSDALSLDTGSVPFNVGWAESNGITSLDGYVGDVIVYDEALDQTAINSLVAALITRWAITENHAPTVDAGEDQTVSAGESVTLDGSGSDPDADDELTYAWTRIDAPGMVEFADESSPTTTVQFGLVGDYILRLTVSDGEFTDTDDVTIHVQAGGGSGHSGLGLGI